MVKGNTFAATAFFSYGAFWMAFFVMKYLVKTSVALGAAAAYSGHFQVGETLIMVLWGVFTTAFFVPTLRKNGCLMFVFGSLAVTFFLLAGGQWSKACLTAAGYMGFVCGCSAMYTAFAEIWQEALGWNMPGLKPVRFV
jgi:succinate-acetate transporter protein